MRMKPKINAKKPDRKTNSGKDPLQELKIKSDLNKRTQSSELGINQANHEHSIQWHLKTHSTYEIENKITTDLWRLPSCLSLSFYYCNEMRVLGTLFQN
jgi:hypothetical protein